MFFTINMFSFFFSSYSSSFHFSVNNILMNYFSQLSSYFFWHQYILIFCIFILVFLWIIFVYLFYFKHSNVIFTWNFLLEYYWTLLPVIIVLALFLPLFNFNNFFSFQSEFSYFILANQWFWDFICLEDQSFNWILSSYDFLFNSYPCLYLPSLYNIVFFLTSNDVLHAFSLPHLYTMIDLVPGALHTIDIFFPYVGVFTVYCAQICGINHWAMPFIINSM